VVDGDLLRAVFDMTVETGNQYYVGCFVSMLAYSVAPLHQSDIQVLFNHILNIEELARHVALHTLTFRCLRASGRAADGELPDPAADELRRGLVPTLVECFERPETNAVTRSLAWCGLRALHKLYPDSLAPPGPWPGLGPEQEGHALRMLCPWRPDESCYRSDNRQRTMQTVYVRVQLVVLVQRFNAITTVHGMYMLATALRHNGAIAEVANSITGIAEMLAEHSEFTKAVRKDAEGMGIQEELMTIWKHCRWACGEGRDAHPSPPPG